MRRFFGYDEQREYEKGREDEKYRHSDFDHDRHSGRGMDEAYFQGRKDEQRSEELRREERAEEERQEQRAQERSAESRRIEAEQYDAECEAQQQEQQGAEPEQPTEAS